MEVVILVGRRSAVLVRGKDVEEIPKYSRSNLGQNVTELPARNSSSQSSGAMAKTPPIMASACAWSFRTIVMTPRDVSRVRDFEMLCPEGDVLRRWEQSVDYVGI